MTKTTSESEFAHDASSSSSQVIKDSNESQRVISQRPSGAYGGHQQEQHPLITYVRAGLLATLAVAWLNEETINQKIADFWDVLRVQPWYTTPYHETFLVVVIGSIFQVLWFIPLRRLPNFQKYRLDFNRPKDANENSIKTTPEYTMGGIFRDTLRYTIPLLLLDTFTRKYYQGVDVELWASKPYFGWQTERLLPPHAPTIREVIWQTVVALLIYDFIFYFVHRAFHRYRLLMKYIHGVHHHHATVHHGVTNQLTVIERVFLILTANASLKVLGGHPLTRNVFTIVFVFILLDTHSNFDLPLHYDKVIPFQIVGGSKHHWIHHVRGDCNFAPIFSHMDRLFGTHRD